MDMETGGYTCVDDSGSDEREERLITLIAKNLANFIGGEGEDAQQISGSSGGRQ